MQLGPIIYLVFYVVCFLFCVDFVCLRPVSCVPNIASFLGLFILDIPIDLLDIWFWNCSNCVYFSVFDFRRSISYYFCPKGNGLQPTYSTFVSSALITLAAIVLSMFMLSFISFLFVYQICASLFYCLIVYL
jgi:hypothetical protein